MQEKCILEGKILQFVRLLSLVKGQSAQLPSKLCLPQGVTMPTDTIYMYVSPKLRVNLPTFFSLPLIQSSIFPPPARAGLTHMTSTQKVSKACPVINPLLAKLVWSRCWDISLVPLILHVCGQSQRFDTFWENLEIFFTD